MWVTAPVCTSWRTGRHPAIPNGLISLAFITYVLNFHTVKHGGGSIMVRVTYLLASLINSMFGHWLLVDSLHFFQNNALNGGLQDGESLRYFFIKILLILFQNAVPDLFPQRLLTYQSGIQQHCGINYVHGNVQLAKMVKESSIKKTCRLEIASLNADDASSLANG